MKIQFVDEFINMKIDECEESIREATEELERIEKYMLPIIDNPRHLNLVAYQYSSVIERKHTLVRSLSRLINIAVKRTIEAMANDPELNKEEV